MTRWTERASWCRLHIDLCRGTSQRCHGGTSHRCHHSGTSKGPFRWLPPTGRRREHVHPGTTVEAVEAYRSAFRPSPILRKPYVVVSADAVVADDDATTRELASTYGHWTHSIRSGHGAIPYPDPETPPPLTDEERALVDDRIVTQFVGAPSTVAERLDTLRRVTDADELVVTSVTHGHEDRLRSYELLAREWGLARVRAA